MKQKKFKVNLGSWQHGSINNKVALWARKHNYSVKYDSRQYIYIFTPHNIYRIHDVWQLPNTDLIVVFESCRYGG